LWRGKKKLEESGKHQILDGIPANNVVKKGCLTCLTSATDLFEMSHFHQSINIGFQGMFFFTPYS
jgi:hypothetical protein